MTKYFLKEPVPALRLVLGENDAKVAGLVRFTGRKLCFSNRHGLLHIFNDGPDLFIEDGQWLVLVGGDVAIMSDAKFRMTFGESA